MSLNSNWNYFLFISSLIFGKLFLFISGDLSGIYDGLNKCGYLLLVNLGEHLTTLDPQGAAGATLESQDTACDFTYEGL